MVLTRFLPQIHRFFSTHLPVSSVFKLYIQAGSPQRSTEFHRAKNILTIIPQFVILMRDCSYYEGSNFKELMQSSGTAMVSAIEI